MKYKSLWPALAVEKFEELPALLEPILPLIWKAFENVWADWRRRRHRDGGFRDLDIYEMAQWIHARVTREISGLLTDRDDVKFFWRGRQFVVNYQDAVFLSFKKIDRRMRRSNIRTKGNEEYWRQAVSRSNGLPLKVLVGYCPTKDLLGFKLYLTLPHGSRVASKWRIPDQTAQLIRLAGLEGPVDTSATTTRKGFHVKPKKDAAEKKRGDGGSG
ncbi:MAG: hypothetical protein WD066_05260 [Planctomycetaceae bacterium]